MLHLDAHRSRKDEAIGRVYRTLDGRMNTDKIVRKKEESMIAN